MTWPVTFFAVALTAGLFGYTGIAAASAGIAQILCLLFAGLGFIALLLHFVPGDQGEPQRSRDRNIRS
ncbi:DUF1328 family protein [Oceanicola sp. S124]|uniref:DUF1328 family protein n=1 Tax=Oceanicola sp. S124 TaxID=1042378 RepID=UPI0002557D42|nr:DUF1328 family protein [Oceanicola sp. S124]